MKKNLLYILIIALLSTSLTSCNSKKKKYEYLSAQIVGTFVIAQLYDYSMSLERFTRLMDSQYNRIGIQKTEDGNGLHAGYSFMKDDKDCPLSKGESFDCLVQYNYERDPNELTMSDILMRYSSASPEDVDQFYSVAMSELKSLLEKYERQSDTSDSTVKYHKYYGEKDNIVIMKSDDSVTVSMFFK